MTTPVQQTMGSGIQSTKLRIVSMMGSHYVGKVVLALDAAGVNYDRAFISGLYPPAELKKRNKDYKTVPVLEVGRGKEMVPVMGSDNILKWVDDNIPTAAFKFYPPYDASPDSKYAEVKSAESFLDRLGLWIIYYHWSDEGFDRTLGRFMCRNGACCCCCCIKSLPPAKYGRTRFKTALKSALPEVFDVNGNYDAAAAKKAFFDDLQKVEVMFKTEGQLHLCDTPQPNAADFMLVACLNSFLGTLGDAGVPAAFPTCLRESGCVRTWNYYERMSKQYPLKFRLSCTGMCCR
eukprot:TRINITY_DN2211_c0_g1_i4.p1 TRINITY_DN2211_c0_g1~~TRINITY_DN2211_c0_g1_i4.p1  ORF type:complete len:313 (-),score=46.64 TRINITY_DN2211_c0_g1_i4:272-1144(-)